MKQLEADEHYTVAQFAQAVGVIYFGNQGLIEEIGEERQWCQPEGKRQQGGAFGHKCRLSSALNQSRH